MNLVDQVRANKMRYEQDEPRTREISIHVIRKVLAEKKGQPEIDVQLALGEACPFYAQWQRAIWLEEVHRLRGGLN